MTDQHTVLAGTTTSSAQPVVIRGAHSSPYSLKMRTVLRERHIPFRRLLKDSALDTFPPGSVPVIPVLIFLRDDGGDTETLDTSRGTVDQLLAGTGCETLLT
jgi:hypothetical protein